MAAKFPNRLDDDELSSPSSSNSNPPETSGSSSLSPNDKREIVRKTADELISIKEKDPDSDNYHRMSKLEAEKLIKKYPGAFEDEGKLHKSIYNRINYVNKNNPNARGNAQPRSPVPIKPTHPGTQPRSPAPIEQTHPTVQSRSPAPLKPSHPTAPKPPLTAKTPYLSIYYQNMQSILAHKGKQNKIMESAKRGDYDIYVFTETWLRKDVTNENIFPSNYYNVIRCDFNPEQNNIYNRTQSRGGGVLIAIRSDGRSLKTEEDDRYESQNIESCWVKVDINGDTHLIGAAYIRNQANIDERSQFYKFATKFFRGPGEKHLLGDFNMPMYASYMSLEDKSERKETRQISTIKDFEDFCTKGNLDQKNEVKNKRGRILDLICTTVKDAEVSKCTELEALDREKKDHSGLKLILHSNKQLQLNNHLSAESESESESESK